MARSLVILVVAALGFIGCVGVGPTASAPPTSQVLPSTSAPTAAPSATAAVTPAAPTAAATTPAGSGPLPGGTSWFDSAGIFGGQEGDLFLFQCPPGGSAYSVWGTDIYTSDSSVCTAAVHAGLITFAAGGNVTIEMRAGQEAYVGSTRNDVTSNSYSSWGSSFTFIGGTVPPSAPPASIGPPSPQPSAGVIEDFGAATLLFADDFSDDTSGWGVGTSAGGTVAYVDDALQFDPAADGAWMVSRRTADTKSSVMRVEGDFTPTAFGYQGLLCGDNDSELWGAAANAAGIYVFAKITTAGASVLTGNDAPGFEIAPGETTRMALDCAGTDTGQFRMQLSIPDLGVAAIYEGEEGEGAASFDRAGIYSEASADEYSLRVDNVSAFGGTGEATMSAAASALLLHVPDAWRDSCFESAPSAFTTGVLATLSCPLTDGRSDIVEYTQFDSQANMDAEYQNRVDIWATDTTVQHCDTGPDEEAYRAGGVDAGRVMCAPQVLTVGIRMDWTFDDLLILSTLTDFESSYPNITEDWQIAGPE